MAVRSFGVLLCAFAIGCSAGDELAAPPPVVDSAVDETIDANVDSADPGDVTETPEPECTATDLTRCAKPAEPDCRKASCESGRCVLTDVIESTPLPSARQTGGDCKVVVCDGKGGTRNDPADDPPTSAECVAKTCASGEVKSEDRAAGTPCATGVCSAGLCVSSLCVDGKKNGGESDVDCGGACPPCLVGATCTSGTDCGSLVCDGGKCAAPTCSDATRNGSETDTDCGGSCPACIDGAACVGSSDCRSGVCTAGKCIAPACSDGVRNGSESDVDCGGSCPTCGDGRGCASAADCASSVCTAGKCAAPSCSDGVKNGKETARDCGGTCTPCTVGDACAVNGDCLSGWCDAGTCRTPSCTDGVRNGSETDVDCGGGCGPCARTQSCAVNADCVTATCFAGRCAYPRFELEAGRPNRIGRGAYDNALADMDGDGRLDYVQLEETKYDGPSVAWMRNLGNRKWGAPYRVPLSTSYVSSLAAVDIDLDGDIDLVTLSRRFESGDVYAKVAILRNDGTGNLLPAVETIVPYALHMIAADFVGDKRPELLITARDTAIYTIGSDAKLTKGSPVASVAGIKVAVDLDGDGDLDVVGSAASYESGRFVVHTNLGGGVLGPATEYSISPTGYVNAGDFDGDGRPDIWIGDASSARIYFNRGSSGFVMGPWLGDAMKVGNWGFPVVADFNHDGNFDVALGGNNSYGSALRLLLNDGKANFSARDISVVQTVGRPLYDDIDGDCRPDLLFGTYSAMVDILPGRAGGVWPSQPAGLMAAHDFEIADLDGDGKLDVLGVATGEPDLNGVLYFWKNLGGRKFAEPAGDLTIFMADEVAVGDFDRDGKIDAAVTSAPNRRLAVHRGKGDGRFLAATTYDLGTEGNDVASGDFDGDTLLDLLVATTNGFSLYRGKGDGTFIGAPAYSGGSVARLAIADVDGDGDLDVIAARSTGATVHLNNKGVFTTASTVPGTVAYERLAVGDLDLDGKPDLAATNYVAGSTYVLKNLGGGSFGSPIALPAPTAPKGVSIGDLDGDGRPDLVTIGAFGVAGVHRATGPLSFAAFEEWTSSPASTQETLLQPTSTLIADMDADGKLDVIAAGRATSVLFNVSGLPVLTCPTCGDGVVSDVESCDDGNTASSDGCSATCRREPGWACSGTRSTCTPVCGDGLLRAGETCDDGNALADDGCGSTCVIETGWSCTEPTAATASKCGPICGDGLILGGEFCDDGNTADDDGCASTCRRDMWTRSYSAPPRAIAAHPTGDVVMIGGFQKTIDLGAGSMTAVGNDVYVARVTASGSTAWSAQIKSTGSPYSPAGSAAPSTIAVDSSGNVLAVGEFVGTIDIGGTSLTAGYTDVFVAKYSPTGSLLWAKKYGGSGLQRPRAIAVDSTGAMFIGGTFDGTFDLGGGSSLTQSGGGDAFLIKLDSSGNYVWARKWGDSTNRQEVSAVALDGSGNVFVGGTFIGTLDLGVGVHSNLDATDAWIAKLDASGVAQWSRSYGVNNNYDRFSSIASLGDGGVIAVGQFRSSVVLGGVTYPTKGDYDAFIIALNGDGSFRFGETFGGVQLDDAGVVSARGTDVYVAGVFEQTVTFGTVTKTSPSRDLFLLRLSSSGAHKSLWTQTGSSISSLALDLVGRIYAAGSLAGGHLAKLSP